MNGLKEFIKSNKLRINYLDNQLNIVNFNEIILLKDDKIILKKDKQLIKVTGLNLIINKLLEQEILITGSIKTIEL